MTTDDGKSCRGRYSVPPHVNWRLACPPTVSQPDLILAIARGGLFVAGALGYALGVKNVA